MGDAWAIPSTAFVFSLWLGKQKVSLMAAVSDKPLVERLREEGNRIVRYKFGRHAELMFEAADALQALSPAASKARTDDSVSLVSEVETKDKSLEVPPQPQFAGQGAREALEPLLKLCRDNSRCAEGSGFPALQWGQWADALELPDACHACGARWSCAHDADSDEPSSPQVTTCENCRQPILGQVHWTSDDVPLCAVCSRACFPEAQAERIEIHRHTPGVELRVFCAGALDKGAVWGPTLHDALSTLVRMASPPATEAATLREVQAPMRVHASVRREEAEQAAEREALIKDIERAKAAYRVGNMRVGDTWLDRTLAALAADQPATEQE